VCVHNNKLSGTAAVDGGQAAKSSAGQETKHDLDTIKQWLKE
jgi:hypothetical protein